MIFTVEFGSRSRGDWTRSSDRDVLLLGEQSNLIEEKRKTYEEKGFSVSRFNLVSAKYLIGNGHLFFKHIIDEGILVEGDSSGYGSLVSLWNARSSYQDDVLENIDLLEIVKCVPRSVFGFMVLNDVLVTSVRNILIRRLAEIGIYVFAWESVLCMSAKVGFIKQEQINLFLEARENKNRYRDGEILSITEGQIDSLVTATELAIGSSLHVSYANRKMIRNMPEKYRTNSYKQLRSLELLCAEYEFGNCVDDFSRIVKDPNRFCSQGHNY